MDYIIEKDKQLLLFLHHLGSEKWDFLWLCITNKWFSIPVYALLLGLCLFRFKAKRTFIILIFIGLMILCCDQLANVFKHGFQRLRPCHDPEIINSIRKVICGGSYGYFSAHAANSFALATFFFQLLKPYYKGIYALFIWAILVSYSRIYLAVHFPGDVITGAFFGVIFGILFFKLHLIAVKKFLKE